MGTDPTSDDNTRNEDAHDEASGRDRANESEPTTSGHSTADDQARRNQEDESPS